MSNNVTEISLWHRIIYHPLSRIIVETVLFFGPLIILKIVLIKPGLRLFGFDENVFLAFQGILTIAAMFAAYIAIMKWYERRGTHELSLKYALRDGLSGILAGAGMVSIVFATLWLAGAWHIISVGSISAMIVPVIWVFVLALWEELIFRGVIYRILEEWLGTILALVLSATFFGGMHIFNDNADLLSVLSATSGGLMMGALYSLTRRLWIPILFHASWNLTQAIFGSVVSGSDLFGTYFVSVREGPEWLTGGPFGVENSLITISLMFVVVAILFLYMKKQDLFLARGGILKERAKPKTGE